MALRSMTGFGRGEATAHGLRAEVELSSVNRKQLDVRINLPRTLSAMESQVIGVVGRSISRGFVSGTITVSAAKESARISIDPEMAAQGIAALRKTARWLGLKDDLTARTLVSLPGVVQAGNPEGDLKKAGPVAVKALRSAIVQLCEMRAKEGNALERDIKSRLAQLEARRAKIEALAPTVAERYRHTLVMRMKKAGLNIAEDSTEVLRELLLFAERSDMTEEVTRLGSHLRQAWDLIAVDKPVGRTLDFLVQEMMREINTIGAKAADARVSRHVVVFKTELERIREQAQNIE